jgi:hypothetical protein
MCATGRDGLLGITTRAISSYIAGVSFSTSLPVFLLEGVLQ